MVTDDSIMSGVMKTFIRDVRKWVFWYPGRFLVPHLPLNMVYAAAKLRGLAAYCVAKERRRVVTDELSRIFGSQITHREIRAITRRSFEDSDKKRAEILWYPKLTEDNINKMVSIVGLKYLDEALSKGKGAILPTAHFGSNRLMIPAMGFRGYPISQMALPSTDWEPTRERSSAMLDKALQLEHQYEKQLPSKFIYVGGSVREAFRCLKNNEVLIVAVDGRTGRRMVSVEFLGRRALFSPGPIILATKTQAALLPAFVVRQRDNTHKLIIEQPLALAHTGDKEYDLTLNTQKLAVILERYIRQYPCQYVDFLWYLRNYHRAGDYPLFVD